MLLEPQDLFWYLQDFQRLMKHDTTTRKSKSITTPVTVSPVLRNCSPSCKSPFLIKKTLSFACFIVTCQIAMARIYALAFSCDIKNYLPENFLQKTIKDVKLAKFCLICDTLYSKTHLLIEYWLKACIYCTIWNPEKRERGENCSFIQKNKAKELCHKWYYKCHIISKYHKTIMKFHL